MIIARTFRTSTSRQATASAAKNTYKLTVLYTRVCNIEMASYRGRWTFGCCSAPRTDVSLATPHITTRRTLVMRMIPWFDILETVNTVNVRPGRLRQDVEEVKEVKGGKERWKCYGCPSTTLVLVQERCWSGSASGRVSWAVAMEPGASESQIADDGKLLDLN